MTNKVHQQVKRVRVYHLHWVRKLLTAFALLLLLAICAAYAVWHFSKQENTRPRLEGGQEFTQLPLDVNTYNVFDAGVVDMNGDSFLDIYLVKHSAQQQFFLNNTAGGFTESQDLAAAFSQDHRIAFSEDADHLPISESGGISIYRLNRWLYIQNKLKTPAEGSINVPWPIEASFVQQARLSQLDLAIIDNHSALSFLIAPGDTLRLRGEGDIVELPHELVFDESIEPSAIHIGQKGLNPADNAFTLNWRDRHAMVWADLDDNKLLDAFITRGGVRGQIGAVANILQDEFFLQTQTGQFTDNYTRAGFSKGACPGREADWLDFNNDGLLDLHVVCGRQQPDFPNQLWQQLPDKTFIEVAASLGLDYPDTSSGVWFDADSNGRTDYLALQPDGLTLYSNTLSGFEKAILSPIDNISHYSDIALADMDADGDIDAFIPSSKGSTILINNDGNLEVQPQLADGLPTRSLDASWVDFNADGLLDLHLVPQGIYLQTDTGAFEATGQMVYAGDEKLLISAACTWFDASNMGVMDTLCHFTHWPDRVQRLLNKVFTSPASPYLQSVELWKNTSAPFEHQLALNLIGNKGNPQALGTTLLFETDDGRRTASQVGIAEGARYSQGHYRVYFSPGASAISSVTVQQPGKTPQPIQFSNVNTLQDVQLP